jgi:hypothetical protein
MTLSSSVRTYCWVIGRLAQGGQGKYSTISVVGVFAVHFAGIIAGINDPLQIEGLVSGRDLSEADESFLASARLKSSRAQVSLNFFLRYGLSRDLGFNFFCGSNLIFLGKAGSQSLEIESPKGLHSGNLPPNKHEGGSDW